MPMIVPLADCAALPIARVGGKAHMLGRMLSRGCTVPAGVCLTTAMFTDVKTTSGLDTLITEQLDLVQQNPILRGKAVATIRRAIQNVPFSEMIAHSITTHVAPLLTQGALVVRSSAPDEDGVHASHAGIYHSVLNVTSLEMVFEAIRACWASLFSERTLFYGRGMIGCDMAVLVQHQVDAQSAGVMFTRNPVTGQYELVVEMSAGSTVQITAGAGSDQRVRIDITEDQRAIPAGLREGLRQLAFLTEDVLGGAADVEWAWDGAALFTLQVRHITSTVQQTYTTRWALQEDIETVYHLPLGQCQQLFMRQLQKKVWYRRHCQERGYKVWGLIYLVYEPGALREHAAALLDCITTPFVRAHWGTSSVLTARENLIETLIAGAANNLLSDGATSATQIGEMIINQISGFASRLSDGNVMIEAFPASTKGLKNGVLTPTRYLLDQGDSVVHAAIATFDRRGVFNETRLEWEQHSIPPFEVRLSASHLERIALIVRDLTETFGEVRLEWYLYHGEIYVKDLSIETNAIALDTQDAVLAGGAANGTVVKITDMQAFDRLADELNISVVSHNVTQDRASANSLIHEIRQQAAHFGSIIAVADYPSVGLIPLIPYVQGFIFTRGALLCHTAIVLREQGIPGIILPNANALLSAGDVVTISPAGVTILRTVSTPA